MTFATAHALGMEEPRARKSQGGALRVLNLHGTPSTERQAFRGMVAWLAERFDVLAPSTFARIVERRERTSRPSLMFTFDDGLQSNFDVAAPVLEEMGFRGWFFVNPTFIDTPRARQRAFFYSHVRYLDDPRAAPTEHFTAMTRAQVNELSRRGHRIGSHTMSHAFLARIPPAALEAELLVAKQTLEEWTGSACDGFAWTFAWDAISDEAWRRANRTYRWCFGGCPGVNELSVMDPHLIFRTNVETGMPTSEFRLLASGFGDLFWSKKRRVMQHRLAALER